MKGLGDTRTLGFNTYLIWVGQGCQLCRGLPCTYGVPTAPCTPQGSSVRSRTSVNTCERDQGGGTFFRPIFVSLSVCSLGCRMRLFHLYLGNSPPTGFQIGRV